MTTLLLIGVLLAATGDSLPHRPLGPPTDVRAADSPNDDGEKITVHWTLSSDDQRLDGYRIERQARDSTTWVRAGFVGPGQSRFVDDRVSDEFEYRFRVRACAEADTSDSEPSAWVRSSSQWFHTGRINVLIAGLLLGALVTWFTIRARRGEKLFLRRITGLDAVDEALGRATEMGRPILYIPGMNDMSDIATIAALNILGEVAKKTATFGTPLICPNRDPIVYTVAREIVKESYTKVGRPDAFNPDSVYFITDNQFAYAAAVDGIMIREKPATNFLMGFFYAESLILAETGAMSGAVQIAGTDSVTQLPFFVTACDYTLLGEELYAASAYLSREPLLMGTIKGQDYGKAIVVIIIIVATFLALAFNVHVERWF